MSHLRRYMGDGLVTAVLQIPRRCGHDGSQHWFTAHCYRPVLEGTRFVAWQEPLGHLRVCNGMYDWPALCTGSFRAR